MKNKNIKKIVTGLAGLGVAAALAGCGGGGGGLGAPGTKVYTQRERLSRPLVNEALATFANKRHEINNTTTPDQDTDPTLLRGDIIAFMKDAAGRDDAHANALAGLLTPDIMQIDLNKGAPASYLGIETNGLTGGTFGGRALTDDVVDISLGAIFGETLSDPKVNAVPAPDGKAPALEGLTKDHVNDGAKNYTPNAFPYMGVPK